MDLCSVNEINALLLRHGFHFSKSKGQNFLIARWVPERIAAEALLDGNTGVLEIGPGVGCLTHELALRAGRVVSVELDERLLPVLAETLSEHENVTVINGDILKTDLGAIVDDYFASLRPTVCANLPYNITSPVITRILRSRLFETVTIMVQREVARRMSAVPNTADYGAFTLLVNYYSEPELLFDVPPDAFEPRPKVTSSVIRLRRRENLPDVADEDLFFRVVRAAFNQRRKTLTNALASGFAGVITREEAAAAIRRAGIEPTIRGEALSLDGFAALTREIKSAV